MCVWKWIEGDRDIFTVTRLGDEASVGIWFYQVPTFGGGGELGTGEGGLEGKLKPY